MKVTTLDQNNRLYTLLNAATCPLRQAITGQLYKESRFVEVGTVSLEDVVINSLPITGDQIQLSVANVNIYVADVQVSGGQFANTKRLGELAALALQTLEYGYGDNYQFDLAAQSILDEPETNTHYVNIRVDFRYYPS